MSAGLFAVRSMTVVTPPAIVLILSPHAGRMDTDRLSRSKSHDTTVTNEIGISGRVNLIATPATWPTLLTRGVKDTSDSPHVRVSRGSYSLNTKRDRYSVRPRSP